MEKLLQELWTSYLYNRQGMDGLGMSSCCCSVAAAAAAVRIRIDCKATVSDLIQPP
jgi:hypothetical protein